MINKKSNIVFFLSAILIEFFFILFAILNIDGNIPLYMFVWFETFLLMMLAFYLLKKKLISFTMPEGTTKLFSAVTKIPGSLSVPLFIILSGILFRLTLFPTVLTTSPDAYRYIWEGKVIANGYNPYEYAPDSPELNHLHTADLPSKINFKDRKAIYPPAAQLVFAAAYLISGDNFQGLKFLYLIAEIITMLFLLKLLYLKNKDLNYIILYAWLPLPVMEYFINAHLDVFGVTFFIVFIYLFEKGNTYKSALFFSLSFLSKFFPLFVFPLLLKKMGIKKTFYFGLIVLAITILFYLPFISKDANIFSFLMLYLEKWEFNASAFYLLKNIMNNETARMVCMVMFITTVGIIAYKYKDFTRGTMSVLIAFIIFSSTVYPWYLGWLAVLNPVTLFYSVTSLLFTVNLSNFTPLGAVWKEYYIVLVIEYVTFFVLLIVDWKKRFID